MGSEKSAGFRDIGGEYYAVGAAVGSQLLDFGSQNLQNITKTAPNIDEKSELRRECVFRQPLARQSSDSFGFCRTHLGAISDKKSKTCHPKRHAKFDTEKVSKINSKRFPK